ncbi:MAG TPA: dTDP-4-dehydrorhamnose reductase [Thermoleophilaceae bacterium]|nr:dTDP-4-dehydrorhamnose reductase [Thermoleophilaceae bacterium]
MRVLVTGAGGMLGHDVVRAAEYVNHDVVALGHAELDVTDGRRVRRTFARLAPDAVVNCAAWTDVDGAEEDPIGATKVNEQAPRHVAAAAAEIGAVIVQPSTDYVFDGEKGEPYVESDTTHPISIYGATKLAGEHGVVEANPRHFIVRTSWLFGSNGGNFVETMLRLGRELGEVVVVRDQVGCPTYTGHLADAIVRLLDGDDYGLHHIAGGGECSWFEFAMAIFEQAGVECRTLSCTTDEFPRPAPRPAYSVLETEREYGLVLPDWREGLDSYLSERALTR